MARREAVSYYVRGSLWAVPALAVVAAIVLGTVLTRIDVGVDSPLAFQGTASDARDLLVDISSTMITVLALVLGLAVVALQVSSTQYSPRLLRNFLRDRTNQVVLGVFVGTFAYAAAGLLTVGVAGGDRTESFPRFAITVAIVLLFVSLAMLVFFADHLAHSIQIDRIMYVVERQSLAVVRTTANRPAVEEAVPPEPPPWAVAIAGHRSGYVQDIDTARLASCAARSGVAGVRLLPRVGEHVVAGTPLALAWAAGPEDPQGIDAIAPFVEAAVRVGFERTQEHDVELGLRQLVDIASKALSPAVNDPYTAVQAVEHLTVILGRLAAGPTGNRVHRDRTGRAVVVVPERTFAEYLTMGCGLVRRYGAGEPTVALALLRLLTNCAVLARDDPAYRDAIEVQAALLVTAVGQSGVDPADLAVVHDQEDVLRRELARRRG